AGAPTGVVGVALVVEHCQAAQVRPPTRRTTPVDRDDKQIGILTTESQGAAGQGQESVLDERRQDRRQRRDEALKAIAALMFVLKILGECDLPNLESRTVRQLLDAPDVGPGTPVQRKQGCRDEKNCTPREQREF